MIEQLLRELDVIGTVAADLRARAEADGPYMQTAGGGALQAAADQVMTILSVIRECQKEELKCR